MHVAQVYVTRAAQWPCITELYSPFNSSHWNTEVEKRKSGRQPRLIVAILKCTWWRILLHGIMMLTEVCIHRVRNSILLLFSSWNHSIQIELHVDDDMCKYGCIIYT